MLRGAAIAGAVAVVLGCSVCAGSASAADGGCAGATSGAVDATLQQASHAVLCLVNSERSTRGLGGLRASRLLSRAARAHSQDMVTRKYFSHVSPGGTDMRQRVLRFGYFGKRGRGRLGETIAWGSGTLGTPAALVRSFMQSAGHRHILLDRRYRDLGIGLALGAPYAGVSNSATLTLDFGRRR